MNLITICQPSPYSFTLKNKRNNDHLPVYTVIFYPAPPTGHYAGHRSRTFFLDLNQNLLQCNCYPILFNHLLRRQYTQHLLNHLINRFFLVLNKSIGLSIG